MEVFRAPFKDGLLVIGGQYQPSKWGTGGAFHLVLRIAKMIFELLLELERKRIRFGSDVLEILIVLLPGPIGLDVSSLETNALS